MIFGTAVEPPVDDYGPLSQNVDPARRPTAPIGIASNGVRATVLGGLRITSFALDRSSLNTTSVLAERRGRASRRGPARSARGGIAPRSLPTSAAPFHANPSRSHFCRQSMSRRHERAKRVALRALRVHCRPLPSYRRVAEPISFSTAFSEAARSSGVSGGKPSATAVSPPSARRA